MTSKKTSKKASEKVSEKISETEDKRLHDYELVVIISPDLDEERIGAIVDNVTQFITGKGGVLSDIEQWGKRKLAYPLKHFMEGYYVLAKLKLESKLTKELNANLQISEEVLRYLLIRIDD